MHYTTQVGGREEEEEGARIYRQPFDSRDNNILERIEGQRKESYLRHGEKKNKTRKPDYRDYLLKPSGV